MRMSLIHSPCPINDLHAAWFGTPDASMETVKKTKQTVKAQTTFASHPPNAMGR
jgi:hypothetical protein